MYLQQLGKIIQQMSIRYLRTVTSEAIIEAVNTALNGSEDSDSASEPVEYTDGTYEGTADGHNV